MRFYFHTTPVLAVQQLGCIFTCWLRLGDGKCAPACGLSAQVTISCFKGEHNTVLLSQKLVVSYILPIYSLKYSSVISMSVSIRLVVGCRKKLLVLDLVKDAQTFFQIIGANIRHKTHVVWSCSRAKQLRVVLAYSFSYANLKFNSGHSFSNRHTDVVFIQYTFRYRRHACSFRIDRTKD